MPEMLKSIDCSNNLEKLVFDQEKSKVKKISDIEGMLGEN